MILVTGATGFVGSEIVKQLIENGYFVRILVRNEKKARQFQCQFGKEHLQIFHGDLKDPSALARATADVTTVIHLVGILYETPTSSFQEIHVEGTRNILTAAEANGVSRFLHMSAINTREHAASPYHQTKYQAEQLVRHSSLNWTIFQPSLIYGDGDQFTNSIADAMRFPCDLLSGFSFPCPGEGKTLYQPIPVTDVASAFVNSIAHPEACQQTYELCGPHIKFKDIVMTIAKEIGFNPGYVDCSFPTTPAHIPAKLLQGYRPVLFNVPFEFARVVGAAFEFISPFPILSQGLVRMMEEDQNGNPEPAREELGIDPIPFSKGIKGLL